MARHRMGKRPPSKVARKIKIPRRRAAKIAAVSPLEGYWVTCSGCSEELQLKPKENGTELVCPLCDHTSEPPGKAFLEQLTRYSLREWDLLLRSVVPVSAAFFFVLVWMAVLTGRSTVPQTGLAASITEDATEIPVASVEGFPSSGTLIVGPSVQYGELISYEGIREGGEGGTAFTGAVREATDMSAPSAHGVGEAIFSKSYSTTTLLYSICLALVVVGLFGYGVFKGFAYERARFKAFF